MSESAPPSNRLYARTGDKSADSQPAVLAGERPAALPTVVMGGEGSTSLRAGWPWQGCSNRGYIAYVSDRQKRLDEWVLLTYRLPREPSAPRLALWRKLKRLGVAQLSDGLVALPADARTREQLEWAAEEVEEAGGSAGVWLARPTTRALQRDVAEPMNEARATEFSEIAGRAREALDARPEERHQVLRRLRAQMRRVERRDFFRPPEREQARRAIRELAQQATTTNQAVKEMQS
jgi:hypothetical protein